MIYMYGLNYKDIENTIIAGPPETDDEEEDNETDRIIRRGNQRTLRVKMEEAKSQTPTINVKVYIPDERDQVLLRQWIVGPICKKSAKWKKFGRAERDEVKAMVMEGIMPNQKNRAKYAVFATTASLYLSHLKVLLGLLQEEYYNNEQEEDLVKGRLQLWQFCDYKGDKHLELPTQIFQLVDKMPGGNSQQHAFCGYLQLLDSVYTWLNLPEAKKQFRMRRVLDQQGLSEAEMKVVSRKERAEEMKIITNTKTLLKIPKPFGDFNGIINLDADMKRKFKESFDGAPDIDGRASIGAYLRDKETKDLFSDMEQWSMDNTIVLSPTNMYRLSHSFLKRIMVKSCHRQQVL